MIGMLLGRMGLAAVSRGGWLVMAVVVALASAGSAWVAWRVNEAGWQANYARQLQAALDESKTKADARYRRDTALLRRQLAEQKRTDSDARIVLKEIYREKPNDHCADKPMPAADERVLNQARTGDVRYAEAAAKPAGQAGTVATNREERAAHAECGIEYRRIASRYSALIEWVNQNLVNEGGEQ